MRLDSDPRGNERSDHRQATRSGKRNQRDQSKIVMPIHTSGSADHRSKNEADIKPTSCSPLGVKEYASRQYQDPPGSKYRFQLRKDIHCAEVLYRGVMSVEMNCAIVQGAAAVMYQEGQ